MKTLILATGDKNAPSKAAAIIRKGGVVVYPTETSYGIGADWTNPRAVRKVFKAKGRNVEKRLPVIVPSLAVMKKYAMINEETKKLARAFMPGPLTLVVPTKNESSVAFRISSHDFANAISKRLEKPLTATSANLADEPPIYDARGVVALFGGKVDAIVDGGRLRKRRASTIYDTTKHFVLRQGPISEKAIARILGKR
ncbi:MAG: threonylcarbamoyl-AMP synthase [Candidatus Aenigmarchaeota archaeon]|nr:threonylcarbamoyl-AMP synthase [Candidatus Aenigmarchaeota archaeon]